MTGAAALAHVPENRNAPEKRHVPENRQNTMLAKLLRIRAIETAGELVGKARLAAMLGLTDRAMRGYAAVDRKMPPNLLGDAAAALEARAAEILEHAAKLRALDAERSDG